MRPVQQRRCVPAKARAVGQLVAQEGFEFGEVVAEEALGAGPVHTVRKLGVRQPLGPVPPGEGTGGRDHGDHEVLWRVQRDELADQGPGGALGGLRVAGDREVVEGAHRDRDRHVPQRTMGGEEALHDPRGERFELVDGRGVGSDERGGELLGAQADTGLAEVGVTDPPFPDPAAFGDHRPQLVGSGMEIVLGVALRRCRTADVAPGLRQILQVVTATLRHLSLGAPAVADDLCDHHAERRGEHQRAHDAHEAGHARHEEEHHRRAHADHRQELHQHALLLATREFRRRFEA